MNKIYTYEKKSKERLVRERCIAAGLATPIILGAMFLFSIIEVLDNWIEKTAISNLTEWLATFGAVISVLLIPIILFAFCYLVMYLLQDEEKRVEVKDKCQKHTPSHARKKK